MNPLAPDLSRCQASFEPSPIFRRDAFNPCRCHARPTHVARFNEPSTEGEGGVIALCEACSTAFVFRFGPAYAEVRPIKSLDGRAILATLDLARQKAESKPLPEAAALFPTPPATGI